MKIYKKIEAYLQLRFRSDRLSYPEFEFFLLSLLDYKVRLGPFKRMKYIDQSNGSVLIPKIAGTYECELQDTINYIAANKYDLLIDIGCAEGYYAVGFAFLNKNNPVFKVYAYDTNDDAIENLKKLALLNHVENKVVSKSLFTSQDLNHLIGQKGVILCDIEGMEVEVLNPERTPDLLKFDILVEIHDGTESSLIQETLYRRFAQTHQIRQIRFEHENKFRSKYMPWIKNRTFIKDILHEGRKFGITWFFMKKIKS